MDILNNPFHILNAGLRDNRARIMELADENSLLRDSNECAQARSDLTNPRKRLSAEAAWLIGIGPKRIKDLLDTLKSSPKDLLCIDNLPPIARANLLAAAMSRLSDYNADDTVKWIIAIAYVFEKINAQELTALINEERIVSGFPEVSDISAIETEIQNRRNHYRQVFKSALDKLPSIDIVKAVNKVVQIATCDGEKHAPILIDDLVDSYEVEAQGFVDKEEANIKTFIEKLRIAIEENHSNSPAVDELIAIVNNWDNVAQPIQLSLKSRGISHEGSRRVASALRAFAIDVFNEHDRLEISKRLTSMMQKVFAEVGEVAERAQEDAVTLENIASERETARKKEFERWESITYEANIGFIFTKKLRISPDGIEWDGRLWDLDSITRVRWGGTQYSSGNIIYTVFLGNNSAHVFIELKDKEIYSNFVDRLWKAVGVRLLTEFLKGLRDGKKYQFGSIVVSDDGMKLEYDHIFAIKESVPFINHSIIEFLKKDYAYDNAKIFCGWHEMSINNEPGSFNVCKNENRGFSASLSYQDFDNIHILEAAVRMLYERGETKMSNLLKGV
jgi:hypothetical protein